MDSKRLFAKVLNLYKPWFVKEVYFTECSSELNILLYVLKDHQFDCPKCNESAPLYDTVKRRWRHLDYFQSKVFIHANVPRIQCKHHQVLMVKVPWARPGSRMTLLFEAFIILLAQNGLSANAIGKQVGEHDTRIGRLLNNYSILHSK